jgi:hypothetical protein
MKLKERSSVTSSQKLYLTKMDFEKIQRQLSVANQWCGLYILTRIFFLRSLNKVPGQRPSQCRHKPDLIMKKQSWRCGLTDVEGGKVSVYNLTHLVVAHRSTPSTSFKVHSCYLHVRHEHLVTDVLFTSSFIYIPTHLIDYLIAESEFSSLNTKATPSEHDNESAPYISYPHNMSA